MNFIHSGLDGFQRKLTLSRLSDHLFVINQIGSCQTACSVAFEFKLSDFKVIVFLEKGLKYTGDTNTMISLTEIVTGVPGSSRPRCWSAL